MIPEHVGKTKGVGCHGYKQDGKKRSSTRYSARWYYFGFWAHAFEHTVWPHMQEVLVHTRLTLSPKEEQDQDVQGDSHLVLANNELSRDAMMN